MLIHPQFDPVAIQLGPLAVHWYGLMYLLGFALFLWLGKMRMRTLNGRNKARSPLSISPPEGERDKGSLRESDVSSPNWDNKMLDDLLFYGVLGVVLGGRLGVVLFYHPGYYFAHPLEILAVWKGGMSFHGGLLGVLVAMWLCARKRKIQWLSLTDFIAPLVPLGLAAGRIGNFINGELWGRPTDVAWGMVFPNVDELSRHPSQLYQFALEGLALFVLLWLYSRKPRPVGAVSGLFLVGYGSFRFLVEYTRNPDDGIFGLMTFGLSMGQWLSLPMVLAGVGLMVWAQRKAVRLNPNVS